MHGHGQWHERKVVRCKVPKAKGCPRCGGINDGFTLQVFDRMIAYEKLTADVLRIAQRVHSCALGLGYFRRVADGGVWLAHGKRVAHLYWSHVER